MFHFSKDRLAGLDNIILKIALPSKVSPVIPNCPISHEPYPEVEKTPRRKSRVTARVALGDKTNSNSVPTNTTPEGRPEDPALLAVPRHKPCKLGESPSTSMKTALDDDCYRPLPPLPSPSPLKLPSFLDLSTAPSTPSTQTRSQGPSSSLPAAVLICPTPISSRKRLGRKSKKEDKIGPHWIPAFHHPNSPYVPWTWLDLCQGEHEWVCGHQGCDLHLADGSLNTMCGHMKVFRTGMPFDGDDLCRIVTQPITSLAILSTESLIVPTRFCSLPRLPSQSFDMTSMSCHARNKCGTTDAERCLPGKKSREFSMPGGWTFH
ncbi:hypothetical protein PISMIDRAFT_673703 [Pisolithus microcarpus 441]|uniref:Unplaced genomic scaffold scaffold_8, whole genome shotgun sequence n=1 Tax=Pisolithus microcarpus 441 TaxID=765257 RepID=A0A0C9ZRE2_9AGAM|nr:hypothetical protein PISMIDRAFT_673703 [Pisolithus microcarpus 441]